MNQTIRDRAMFQVRRAIRYVSSAKRRVRWRVRIGRHSTRSQIVFLIALVVLVSTFSIWISWDWLRSGAQQSESVSATIRNIALIPAGAITLIVALWRGLVAESHADTARQSLLDERHRQASQMLGSELLAVRLGGIDALRQLAKDHPEQFHVRILQQLCAFVRNPVATKPQSVPPSRGDRSVAARRARLRPRIPEAPEDIQAVMDAFRALGQARRPFVPLDLSGADLSHANLAGIDFSRADLSHAVLHRANFDGARTAPPDRATGMDVSDYDWSYAFSANLAYADLSFADLGEAQMVAVNMQHARLFGADLTSASVASSNLSQAFLGEATLRGATLRESDLTGAQLRESNCTSASFVGTVLCEADFDGTNLEGAQFDDATFSDSDGSRSAVNLTQEQIDKASPLSGGAASRKPHMKGLTDVSGRPLVWRVESVVAKSTPGGEALTDVGRTRIEPATRGDLSARAVRLRVVASHSAIQTQGTIDIICTVLDESEKPVAGVKVHAVATLGSIGANPDRMVDARVTNREGQALFRYQAPSTAGVATITVLTDELTASIDVVVSGSPRSLSVEATHHSIQVQGTVDIVCTVVDGAGWPVPGVAVRASVMEGGGRIEGVEQMTDAAGRSVFTYEAPGTTGTALVVARTGQLEAATEVAVAGPPAAIVHDAPETIEVASEMTCHYTVLDDEGVRIDDARATVSLLTGGGRLEAGPGRRFVYSAPSTATRAVFEINAGDIREVLSVTVR